ncbi:shikimate kinase AroK [Pseudomaricurvus alkylphenolicus]|uniref:shikimate kinase AroK n=1 Tax=Pseudomaricurvus alkylphenolicus TaxID=1306991 RepID=UPI0014224AAE|nr:shikimate kinase AroK [Pseudomaricurvus alkylphenolicus]NIB39342.1 shikimate kinase AroK [Pseudomaricurvus alkylphenolicus]
MTRRSLVLVGPMGAGKSTIGKLVAAQLSLPFVDTDRVIEERTGADIPWIFDVEGEEGFRQRETSVLGDLLVGEAIVLATGGGIVTREQNRKLLEDDSLVVYLTASIDQLVERTYKDKKRPLLQVADPEAKIRSLIAERHPLYEQVADVVVQTDRRSPKAVANEIAQFYHRS